MKKIFTIFIIIAIIGTMFAGCGKEAVAEETTGFVEKIVVEDIIVEEIIVEEIITEEIITEEIITEEIDVEDVWVSSEYLAEVEYNSKDNEY